MSALPFFKEKVQPIINFMMVDNPTNDAAFLARTSEVDSWRSQSLADTHPELYALVNGQA